jgi:hypothetical protein
MPIKFLHFNLYRCTEFVTYTASSVFAMGYAYSTLLAPLPVSDSRVPKPWRKEDRGRIGVRAQYPEPPDAWQRMQRVDITISGRRWTSLAEAVPREEFPFVNDHLAPSAIGRERTRAYAILVLISSLTLFLAVLSRRPGRETAC